MKGSVGGPIAALSAIAVAVAAFLPFWDGAKPRELALRGLWEGYSGLSTAAFLASLALPMIIGAVILVGSTVAGSQALSFLGGVWILGLLAVFTAQARGSATISDFLVHDVDWGFWVAAGGGLIALVAACIPRSVSSGYSH